MIVYLGKDGLKRSHQSPFPETVECVHCKGKAEIAFVGMEEGPGDNPLVWSGGSNLPQYVCDLHKNEGPGKMWLHDCCAVAVYLCRDCLKPTALANQG